MILSIRRFLILVSLAATVVVIFIASFQGYRAGTIATQSLLDQQLAEKSQLLRSEATLETSESVNQLFQIFDRDGQLVRGSPGAPETPISSGSDGFIDVSHDGILWRTLSTTTPSGELIVVAERRALQFEIVEEVVTQTLLPIGIGIPVLAVLIGTIITFGLRHLRLVERELRARSSQNLQALTLGAVPLELQPLLETTNSLLDRLEAAFERERRFAGDAAHELRTPVSALKIDVFNLGKKIASDDPDIRAIEQNLDRMGHIIEQLLMLYRASSEQIKSQFQEIQIKRLCQEVITDLYPLIQARQQQISLEGDEVVVNGHSYALSALIKNIVDNASKYSPRGATIEVRILRQGQSVTVDVIDSGPGIPDRLKERVAHRFVRGTDVAHTKIPGCGLGLSIVDLVAKLHQGTWALADGPNGLGTKVSLSLALQGKLDESVSMA